MDLFRNPVIEKEAALYSPLQLAYIGDTVWELIVRDDLLHKQLNVHHLHVECVKFVNAAAQSMFLNRLRPMLTDSEEQIVRRGINAHARHPVPKNQAPKDYAQATGFEALLGFLFMTGQYERIRYFADVITGGAIDA